MSSCFSACLIATTSFPANAQPAISAWGLPQLMQSLAQIHIASANFTERQTMQMLTTPLLSTGSLTYIAPAYLRKTTIAPVPETFILDHGVVTLSGGPDHQTHVFTLGEAPQIGALVEGIRATLAGDLPALQRLYTIRLTGAATNWQLLLQPKNCGVTQVVKWIIIQGSQNHIDAIDTASPNGDHSEMGIAENPTPPSDVP